MVPTHGAQDIAGQDWAWAEGADLAIDLPWVMGCCHDLGTQPKPLPPPRSLAGPLAWLLAPPAGLPDQGSQLGPSGQGSEFVGGACGWVELGPGKHRIPGVWGLETVRIQDRRALLCPTGVFQPSCLWMVAARSRVAGGLLGPPSGTSCTGTRDTRQRSQGIPGTPATCGSLQRLSHVAGSPWPRRTWLRGRGSCQRALSPRGTHSEGGAMAVMPHTRASPPPLWLSLPLPL